MIVHRDGNVVVEVERTQRAAVDYARTATGFSAPEWVVCPRCSVGKGDPCRSGTTCEARVHANAQRLLALPTWGVGFETPCCSRTVWLVWRTTRDDLEWREVPCFGCGSTFNAKLSASDLVPKRVPVQRVHPDRVEVVCWASEESHVDRTTAGAASG